MQYLTFPVIGALLLIVFQSAVSTVGMEKTTGVAGVPASQKEGRVTSAPPLSATDPCALPEVICENEIYATSEAKNQTVYAYSSDVAETDLSPDFTASGFHLVSGSRVVANNCIPFGTVVRIDGQIYTVQDRMNKRYGCGAFDIWMETKKEARQWGKRYLPVTVLE